jgi:7-cyano-7-deazaguanine reductase
MITRTDNASEQAAPDRPAEIEGLTLLGAGPRNRPANQLESFPNPHPQRAYHIRIESQEFTTLCPITGQPDFATITLEYVPGPRCVELKAYKLYLWHFRDEGAFHEDVVNRILDDVVAAIEPRWARLIALGAADRRVQRPGRPLYQRGRRARRQRLGLALSYPCARLSLRFRH